MFIINDNYCQFRCQLMTIFETKIRFATKIFKNQEAYFVFALMNAAHCIGEQNKNLTTILRDYHLLDQLRPCEVE